MYVSDGRYTIHSYLLSSNPEKQGACIDRSIPVAFFPPSHVLLLATAAANSSLLGSDL